jgi:hypothetical protein
MSGVADALDRLPPAARARLAQFGSALERVRVDNLPMNAVRSGEPAHRRAVEAAAAVALDSRLAEPIEAARASVLAYINRAYTDQQLRMTMWDGRGLARTDDRVRVMRSLGEAVTALVLWDALDESDRAELLGVWANLLPP